MPTQEQVLQELRANHIDLDKLSPLLQFHKARTPAAAGSRLCRLQGYVLYRAEAAGAGLLPGEAIPVKARTKLLALCNLLLEYYGDLPPDVPEPQTEPDAPIQ